MRFLSRTLNALFALWFAVVLGDPGALHTCAMHAAGHGASHVVSAGEHMAMHSGAAPAGVAHGSGSHSPGDGAPVCTCVGHCCAMSVVAPLPSAPTTQVAEVVAEQRDVAAEPLEAAPSQPDLRLPFGNGPPRA
jgi:hypothetical protein